MGYEGWRVLHVSKTPYAPCPLASVAHPRQLTNIHGHYLASAFEAKLFSWNTDSIVGCPLLLGLSLHYRLSTLHTLSNKAMGFQDALPNI